MQGFPLRTVVGVAVGLGLMLVWLHLANKPKVIINWGMIEELEGAEVRVDGETVGMLKKFGENPTTGFEVSRGEHEIQVMSDAFTSEPLKITFDSAGQGVRLMADIEERYNEDGGFSSVLVLRR